MCTTAKWGPWALQTGAPPPAEAAAGAAARAQSLRECCQPPAAWTGCHPQLTRGSSCTLLPVGLMLRCILAACLGKVLWMPFWSCMPTHKRLLLCLEPPLMSAPRRAELDEDLPAHGQHYCIACARYFISPSALEDHEKTKPHRR